MWLSALHSAIADVAPIKGITSGRKDDRTTWAILFQDEATEDERASAYEVLESFDISTAPAEKRLVSKSIIIDRLQDAGLLGAARQALDAADLYTKERWNTRTSIYADDPTAVGLLTAIGADPETILAPE